jgi:hypothetical protein
MLTKQTKIGLCEQVRVNWKTAVSEPRGSRSNRREGADALPSAGQSWSEHTTNVVVLDHNTKRRKP